MTGLKLADETSKITLYGIIEDDGSVTRSWMPTPVAAEILRRHDWTPTDAGWTYGRIVFPTSAIKSDVADAVKNAFEAVTAH